MTKPKDVKPKIFMRNGRWTYSGMPRWVRSAATTMRWARAQVWVYSQNKRLAKRRSQP